MKKTPNDNQKVLVGGMVAPAIRAAVEELARKKERSKSYITAKVLELDPETLEDYRPLLEKQLAAA